MAATRPRATTYSHSLFPMHAQVPDFPWEGSATHPLALTPIFYMDASDFKEEDSPDYFGLAPSKWVGLKYSGCIYANEIRKDLAIPHACTGT